ncbi:MAG: NADH-quinone oxidoreductase subunit K [Verrucomicrobiales bacterium]|nr:NADH-quinone oxidoreductase subunit K [Verrucomicrobiales bacterium]
MSFDHLNPHIYLGLAAFLLAAGIWVGAAAHVYRNVHLGEFRLGCRAEFRGDEQVFSLRERVTGQVCVLFIMGIAAAEVALALGICIAVYRHYRSIGSKEVAELRG